MNATPAKIADLAASIRACGTGRKTLFTLAGGTAEIYLCPQPHVVECWLTLSGVPMAVAQDIDQGGWKKLESALAALHGVRLVAA